MGQPMLNNLIKKGFGVVAYDIVPAALEAAVKLGATACGSAADAARQSDLVVTVLPSSSHVEAVYLGAGGVLEGVAKGRLCVDMSTIEPLCPAGGQRLRERVSGFIDAPVSGVSSGRRHARDKVGAGGDLEGPARRSPGGPTIHVGPVGAGESQALQTRSPVSRWARWRGFPLADFRRRSQDPHQRYRHALATPVRGSRASRPGEVRLRLPAALLAGLHYRAHDKIAGWR